MTRIICATILCTIVLSAHQAQADDPKRTATVVDTAGTTSEVTDLRFSAKLQKFNTSDGQLAFSVEPFDIAVPLDSIISIEAKGDNLTIAYLWRGKTVSATGTLFSGEFAGKSDFGDLKLRAGKLKSLKFDQAPKPDKEIKKAQHTATLTLADGKTITVDNLRRHDSYYSSEGHIMGGSTRYRHYNDFCFLRGESLATVSFDKIRRTEIVRGKTFSVILKNGKMAIGTRSFEKGADIVGWTGVSEQGEIFLLRKEVNAIEFHDESAQYPWKTHNRMAGD